MPNWCECELTVKGSKVELKKYIKQAKGPNGVLDFNKFIPYPEKFEELDESINQRWKEREKNLRRLEAEYKAELEKYPVSLPSEELKKLRNELPNDGYNQGGYEWCIAQWGTKWNASDPLLVKRLDADREEKDDIILYDFSTAWSPPMPVVKKMSELFPELLFTLKCWEGGGGYRGLLRVKNNKVLAACTYDYCGNRGG